MSRVLLVAVAAAALAGCGEAGSTRIVSNSLSVTFSVPLHGDRAADGRDMVRGAKLALQEAGGAVGELTIGVVALNSVERGESRWTPEQVADNARQAARNGTSVAYVGDLESGATAISLPLTDEAGVLHVAPLSAHTGLTRRAGPGEPERHYPSGSRTLARLVPTGAVQARALAGWMAADGVRSAALRDDDSLDGRGLAVDLRRALRTRDVAVADVGSPADAVILAGADVARLASYAARWRRDSRDTRMYAIGPAASAALADRLGARGEGVRLVTPVPPPRRTPEAARLASRYRAAFGAAPGPAALYGYEAMRGVVQAVRDAGPDGNDRPSVTHAFLTARRARSVLGPYAFDRAGDTTSTVLGGYRVAAGSLRLERILGESGR